MLATKSESKHGEPKKPVAPPERTVTPELAPTSQRIAFQLFTRPPAAPPGVGGSGNGDSPLPASNTSESASSSAPFRVIVDDGLPLEAGQMHRREFIDSLFPQIERVADEELAASGRSARDCPYLIHWLNFYREQSASHLERAIQRYANPGESSLETLQTAVFARVRTAVRAWVRSGGREVQAPDGVVWLGNDDRVANNPAPTGGIQRFPVAGTAAHPPASDPQAVRAQLTNGHSLDSAVRTRMERNLGSSFADVRLHTDTHAARMASSFSARAFTIGDDIAFAAGQYKPGTLAGDALLAHELAHTLQQRTAATSGDEERDANRAALALMTGSQPQAGGVGGLRLQRCSVDEINEFEEDHEALRRMSPAELIARYTTDAGDLDEDRLGALLARMAWYTPSHFPYIRSLFNALDSTDRDDVAAALVANTQDRDLAEIANTPEGRALLNEIVPELRGGWESGGEQFAAVRVLRALRARSAAREAAGTELERLQDVVAATGAPVSTEPTQLLGQDDLERRLRLVEVSLDRMGERWRNDSTVTAAIIQARNRVPAIRQRIATEALALSSTIPEAQMMLETCEAVIPALDAQLRHTTVETGTEEADARLVGFVRERFVESLGATLGSDAGRRFAQAGAALSSLSSARVAIGVAVLQRRPGLFGAVTIQLQGMNAFAGWLIEQIHALETEGAAIAAAERRGEVTTPRRQAANRRYQILSKSLQVLGHWDQSITAAEALESGFSFTEVFYTGVGGTDITQIHLRLRDMAEAARADNLQDLSTLLRDFENDEEIREYYEDIPDILRTSGIVVAIGVTLVAAAVTWGIGAAVAAPAAAGGAVAGGTTAAGTTSAITIGSVATGVGAVAANALLFTSIHRGLSEAVGIGAHGSFLEDFIWNFALFGALRVVGGATGSFLRARNLMRIAGPVQLGAAFTTLELYGVTRFRVEAGRWPRGSEFAQMTAQNVVMLAALSGMHATFARFSPLGVFQARYGESFGELEAQRLQLERDTAEALQNGTITEQQAALRQRGETLRQQFADLVGRVTNDPNLNLAALKAQLQALSAREVATGALTETLEMPREVALERSGGEFQFSYRQGETVRVEDGARALGATEVRVIRVTGRPTVVEALFADRPPMLFVERAAEALPTTTATTVAETLSPAEQNAQRLALARDALARRRIRWSQVPTELRALERARPGGQSNQASIAETTRLLTELEAWIEGRTETPWQRGQEVKVNAPVSQSRAHLSELPVGELREHLQTDDSAVVVFGALRQTSATAAARMQVLWEAWAAVGREGSFADFAESALREEAVAALRASGETRLANALQGDARVQNAFARMGYDLSRLRAVDLYHEHGYSGALTLAEYLSKEVGSLRHESRAWGARRANLVLPVPADGYAPLRTRLATLRTANALTDVDVGIIWRWNRMIQALIEQSAARVPGSQQGTRAETVLQHLLDGLGKDFSESAYRTFRHRIRDLIVDDILYVRDQASTAANQPTSDGAPVRPWAEQLTRLETWEGRAPAGDAATIGALWTAYVQARFALGLPAGSNVSAIAVVPERSLVLVGGRMGDAVLQVTGPLAGRLASVAGEWAADYKGGSDPFSIEQANNYSANMQQNNGSFMMGRGAGAHMYNGLILIFRDSGAASRAAGAMNDAGLHLNLKVAYFGQNGSLVWLR